MAVASNLKVVVGLGNPGSQYQRTRHNAGFWFLDELATCGGAKFRTDPRSQGETAAIDLGGKVLHLLKPMTFMNRSGQAVATFARYHKVQPREILVVHDELDFVPGVLRLKVGGGHGGHNGLRDIIAVLGNSDFVRLRLGIGRPADRRPMADYVLSKPAEVDERAIHDAIRRGVDCVASICSGDLMRVMNQLNADQASDSSRKLTVSSG